MKTLMTLFVALSTVVLVAQENPPQLGSVGVGNMTDADSREINEMMDFVRNVVYPEENEVTGTTYTFQAEDLTRFTTFTSSDTVRVTVPPDVFPRYTRLMAWQRGSGPIYVNEGQNVDITYHGCDSLIWSNQSTWITLWQLDDNEWYMTVR